MKISQSKLINVSICAAFILQMNLSAEDKSKSESLGSVDVISTGTIASEGTNSYTFDRMKTSTKLTLTAKETPQSVSVLTTQKILDLGITSYQNMLGYVTGVSIDRWDERMVSSARGFNIDFYKIDGMPTYTTYNERDLDLSMYDRVEIVRGANGLTTGAGNPGMSINLVRKRANSKELAGNVSISAGSWNAYSATIDVSTGLNEDGTVRGRIVAKHEDSDSYMDGYSKKNNLIYGVVDSDLTDTTYLSVGASYHKLDRNGIRWGGLPAFDSNNNRIDFDRSKIVSEDWTYWDTENKSIFANLEQKVYKDISLNLAYTYDHIIDNNALLYFKGNVNKTDGSGITSLDFEKEREKKEHNFDLNVNIPFELGDLDQEVVVGTSYNLAKQLKYDGRYPNGYYDPVPNFYDYNISLPSSSITDVPYIEQAEEIKQQALYLAGKFSLTDDLKLITGARLSSWKYTSEDNTKETREFENELTPYFGLVYNLNENHSIYTSYTSIFNPQDEKNKSGNYLEPIKGKAYEAGVKGEYFDGVLNASLSVFKIEQDGVAQLDGKQTSNPALDAYKAAKGVVSKGYEVDVSGQITNNLSLDFGFARFKAEDAEGEKHNTKASRTTANIFAKYLINDLTIGGGLQYKSKAYTGEIVQDAYTVANAMVGYKINKKTNLQLNIDNIFDKKYYSGLGKNSMSYGDERKITLALKYTF